MHIFVNSPYVDDSVNQTVWHALNILYAGGIFAKVSGGSVDGRAIVLVETQDETKALWALRNSGMRAAVS
jgi:hypothetical protein